MNPEEMKWQAWQHPAIPQSEYYFNSVVYSSQLIVRMCIQNNNRENLKFIFNKKAIIFYKLTNETYRLLTFDILDQALEKDFTLKNHFLISYNSSFCISLKMMLTPDLHSLVRHYCIKDSNDIMDIVSTEEPKIEVVKIAEDAEGLPFNQPEE